MNRIRLWAIPAALAAGVLVLVYVYGFAPETTETGQPESLLFHGNDTFLVCWRTNRLKNIQKVV